MPSRSRTPRAAATAVLAAVMLALLVACGGGGHARAADRATTSCRSHWKDLRQQVRGNDQKTNPSALAERWNSVVATIDYYASTAKASGCEAAVARQKDAITALARFGTRLAPYDMELRLQEVRQQAEAYAARPAPSPSPVPKTGHDKRKQTKRAPTPPTPAQVAAALKALTTQAPLATQQQGPGWQQARVIDLSDPAAVSKAVKDLAFLSTQSAAWRACAAYLAQVRTALAATTR